MSFSTGQKIFALIFIVAFAIGIIWSYRKDINLHKIYYKKVWLVLIIIILAIYVFKELAYYLHD